jgi:ribosomal RNA-processing protein 9
MAPVQRKSKSTSRATSGAPSSKRSKTIDLGWNSKNKDEDEHIDSGAESDDERYQAPSLQQEKDDEELEETLDAKKVRLAREYLRKIEADDSEEESDKDDSEEDDDETEHDRVGRKLQRERLKREGTLETAVAAKVDKSLSEMQAAFEKKSVTTSTSSENEAREWVSAGHVKMLRGHDLTPTCVALQSNGERAISGSKDHSVIIWDVERSEKAFTLCETWKKAGANEDTRNKGEVLSVACSDDGRYAAVGRRDASVCIFDIRSGKNNLVKTFTGHKGAVTCLSFRSQSLQLFSGSDDRCIRYVS